MPRQVSDPLKILKHVMRNRKSEFRLKHVHPDQVEAIIAGLKNSNSFGLDEIDTYVIKLVRREILPALTHIINLSISTKTFPSSWKKVKIIPLHKKEDRLNPKNYRPVALVPVMSKILEKVIFNQMMVYLEDNELLNSSHHAYRAHHNTTTALIEMYDGWVNSMESGKQTGICFLDLSAAFDVVNHSLLLEKLALYGFDYGMINWLHSYLSSRSQCVLINGCLSSSLPVNTGVPQGSILGPLLYTLFTNELPQVVEQSVNVDKHSSICCYADDTTLSCTASNKTELSEELSVQYKAVTEFMSDNGLKVNDDK